MQSMKQFSHQISSLLILFMHFLLLWPGLQIQACSFFKSYISASVAQNQLYSSALLLNYFLVTRSELLVLTSVKLLPIFPTFYLISSKIKNLYILDVKIIFLETREF
jgi:hypothetical protein